MNEKSENNNSVDVLKKTILAMDDFTLDQAEDIIDKYATQVYGFKFNHILYPYVIKDGIFAFADYKLFDTPRTVELVVKHLIDTGAEMVTVHMTNNDATLDVLSKYVDMIKIVGVSVLTSWANVDCLWKLGLQPEQVYEHSVTEMESRGFWGMICSVNELKLSMVEKSNLKKICPGIRTGKTTDQTDAKQQVRIATPEQAFSAGADFIVQGRSFFNNY